MLESWRIHGGIEMRTQNWKRNCDCIDSAQTDQSDYNQLYT